MRRSAIVVLLAFMLVAVVGCGAMGQSGTTSSSSATSTAGAQQTGPGSAAWKTQAATYLTKSNALNYRIATLTRDSSSIVDMDLFKITGKISAAEKRALQAAPGKYDEIAAEAQALDPPAELQAAHASLLHGIALERTASAKMANGWIKFATKDMATASGLYSQAATEFQNIVDEVTAFTAKYGDVTK